MARYIICEGCEREQHDDNFEYEICNDCANSINPGLIADQKLEIERLEEKLQRIEQWCKAYPRTVFIEPTKEQWRCAEQILDSDQECPSLTAISGSNMRHVVEGIKAFAAVDKERHGLGSYSDGMAKLGYRSGTAVDKDE
jgi:hypothetical protein